MGVYGVVSFGMSQRTREMGIRVALGASSRDILNLVWLQGVRLVSQAWPSAPAAAWALHPRHDASARRRSAPSDPVTYVTVATLLAAVALLACWFPRAAPCASIRWSR